MYILFALLPLCLGVLLWYRQRSNWLRPPGPFGLPIVGNLFDIPRKEEVLAYSAMADKYGDIAYMSVLGKRIFVISSMEIIDELFSKRSTNYSHRPYSTMLNKLMGLEWIFALRSYGNTWRSERKMFHSQFQESAISEYRPVQLKTAHDIVRQVMASPDDLLTHLHTHVASFLMGITYAMEMTPKNARYIKLADEVILAWSKVAVPGAYLVDILPIMRFIPEWLIPGGGFQKDARECKEKAIQARYIPFETVINEVAQGTAKPSFVSKALAEAKTEADMNLIKSCAGTVYFAGTEAIAIILHTFILAMVAHPDVVVKAQQELDSVVGKDRLPTFDDQSSLPYVNAIIKELLRWNPPAPLAIPHVAVNADEYKGYHIPAGSIIIGSLWKILHNPEVYPDPMRFNPDRFIPDTKGNDLTAVLENYESVYGLGRRVCPGRFVGVQQLFITIAAMLSVFDIGPGLDENGNMNEVNPDFSFGLTSHPLPFKFKITPRGDYVQHLLDLTD